MHVGSWFVQLTPCLMNGELSSLVFKAIVEMWVLIVATILLNFGVVCILGDILYFNNYVILFLPVFLGVLIHLLGLK